MTNNVYTIIFNGTGEGVENKCCMDENLHGKLANYLHETGNKITWPTDELNKQNNAKACVLNGIGCKEVASRHGVRLCGIKPRLLGVFALFNKYIAADTNKVVPQGGIFFDIKQALLAIVNFFNKYSNRNKLDTSESDKRSQLLIAVTGKTLEEVLGSDNKQAVTGDGRLFNAQRALLWLYDRINNNSKDTIHIQVVGWSRGATSATYFINKIGKLIDYMKINGIEIEKTISVNSLLMDPVVGAEENEFDSMLSYAEYCQLNIERSENGEWHVAGVPINECIVLHAMHEMRHNFIPQTMETIAPHTEEELSHFENYPVVQVGLPGIHDDHATSVGGSTIFKHGIEPHEITLDLIGRLFSLENWPHKKTTDELLSMYDVLADNERWERYIPVSDRIGVTSAIREMRGLSWNDITRTLSRTGDSIDERREQVRSPRKNGYYAINVLHEILMKEQFDRHGKYSSLFNGTFSKIQEMIFNEQRSSPETKWLRLVMPRTGLLNMKNYYVQDWFLNLFNEQPFGR